jgi:hypothetical protein
VKWLTRLRSFARRSNDHPGTLLPQQSSASEVSVIDSNPSSVPAKSDERAQELTPESVAICQSLRQGDVLGVAALPVVQSDGAIGTYPAPDGAVLLSQTCDVVLPARRTVVVAPVVRLEGDSLKQAKKGLRPRYVAVPGQCGDVFADLDVIATLEKDALVGIANGDPGPEEASERRFGRSVARRFGRFAFPDEVVPWLTPLADIVTSKYGKDSGEALALEAVVELRVESESGWTSPPYDLTLVVVVRSGTLPELEEEQQFTAPASLQQWLRGRDGALRRTPGEIANRLFTREQGAGGASTASPHERYHLWLALAEAWAAKCVPRGADRSSQSVLDAVTGGVITPDIVSDDEYSLSRYRRSERLDVEHLSPPPPS